MDARKKADSARDTALRTMIKEALIKTDNNRLAAAARLGMSRSTLYRALRRLGLRTWTPLSEPGLVAQVTGRR